MKFKLVEDFSIEPSIELEKIRIKKILDILSPIQYGFISIIDGQPITDRDGIHNVRHLDKYYKVNTDPEVTIQNQLGICQDQAIVTKYLFNKYFPDDQIELFALRKNPKGHCVACYCHDGDGYYLENSGDKEMGLHGPFADEDELQSYLKDLYYQHHKYDTPEDSPVQLDPYIIPAEG